MADQNEEMNEKRKRAVDINFEIGKFKGELAIVLKEKMGFKGIENTADNLEIAIALYCMGSYAVQAPCNIMLSQGGSGIENCINYVGQDEETIEKDAAGQLEDAMINKIKDAMKNTATGASEVEIRHKIIWYGQKPEFNDPIVIAFGVYGSANENTKIKIQIYKKLIVDFLMDTIKNMSDFDKFSQDSSTFWNDISYNFIENYKGIVYEHYNLPDMEQVEQVSKSPYEKRECRGGMVFESSKEAVKDIIELDRSYKWSFKDTEFVRKMLEIATEGYYLFVQAEEPYLIKGFGFKSEEEIKIQRAYVRFRGNFCYSVFSKGEEILRCENGNYYPAKEDIEFNIDVICNHYENISGLKGVLQKRDKIEHGAIYIFAEDAVDICNTLCGQYKRGTIVETFSIKDREDFFISLSAVDGAVLADMDGNCYAYGVILDGEAKVEADLTRGSRYNSAKNYVHKAKRLAVVISEDKEREPDIIAGWEAGV